MLPIWRWGRGMEGEAAWMASAAPVNSFKLTMERIGWTMCYFIVKKMLCVFSSDTVRDEWDTVRFSCWEINVPELWLRARWLRPLSLCLCSWWDNTCIYLLGWHYWLLWVVTPTDVIPINWLVTLNFIYKAHNNPLDIGAYLAHKTGNDANNY